MKTLQRPTILCAFALAAAAPAFAQEAPEGDDAAYQPLEVDDRDGVRLGEDACPTTPAGLVPVARGCAAAELVRDPSPLLGEARAGALSLRESVAGERVYGEVERALGEGLAALTEADDAVRAGDACGAMFAAREGVERLYASGEAAARAEVWIRAGISSTRPPVRGATEDPQEVEAMKAAMRASALRGLAERAARDTLGGLDALCRASARSERVRAAVEAVDPATGLVTIAGLRGVALSDRLPGGAGVPGIEMDYDVEVFGDGSGVVVDAGGFVPLPFEAYELPCARLRVEPVEPHAPFVNHPVTFHDIEDYWWMWGILDGQGSVVLEKGMRLGYDGFECDEGGDPRFYRLTATYKSKYDGQMKTRVLAAATQPGDTPVAVPEDAMAGETMTVTAEVIVCADPQNCQTAIDTVFDAQVIERGGYCRLTYDDTTFPPLPVGGHAVAKVAAANWPDFVGPGDSVDFIARGRRVYGGVAMPSATKLGVGDEFAIANPDLFDPDGFLQQELHGVDHAAGLVWPRIRATNGKWQYSCELPPVAFDEIAECGELGSMAYKLPFDRNDLYWTVSQANNGDFTHNGDQAFAFDFVANAGTNILAARAGEVVFVREDQTGNSYADPMCSDCAANAVQIRHDDGTYASYMHMPTDGVAVVEGQRVERGTLLGEVGNTGYSTGPHLHFHVTGTRWSDTTPVAFEAYEVLKNSKGFYPGVNVQTCVVPGHDSKVYSTNKKL